MTTRGRGQGAVIAGIAGALILVSFWLAGTWPAWVVASQSSATYNSDVLGEYVIGMFWAVLLTGVVAVWGTNVRFRGPLLTVWLVKAFICLGPMLFYDSTYGVDVDGYFGNARIYGWDRFQIGDGKQTIYNIAWFNIHFLSDSYYSTRLSFALIGLVAVYLVYRAGTILMGREDRRLFYTLALLPSVLFWSSILGKEPIALFSISAYVYGVVVWQKRGGMRPLLWVALGLIVAVYVRVWLGPILVIPLAVLGWQRTAGLWRRLAFVAVGVTGVLLAPALIQETMGIDLAQREEVLDNANSLARSFDTTVSSATLQAPELGTSGSVLMFAPLGIFTVLFRPFPGEVPNLFGSLAGLDNVLLLFLAARAVKRTRLKDLLEPLVMWALLTVLIWAFIYAIDSYQNLGTASRHRLEITPLMLGLLLYLGRRRDGKAVAAAHIPAVQTVHPRLLVS